MSSETERSVSRSESPLLTPEDVADVCALSRRAVYRAIERGELRASRLCSRIRIRPADVEAWVEKNEIAATTASPTPRPGSLRSGEGLRRLLAES